MDDEKRHDRIEFDDLQGELSGSGNKAARFLDPDQSPRNRHIQERKARERAFQTQLDLLMLNPEYAAAYERVSGLIDEAQEKLNAAMGEVAQRIEHLETLVSGMEDDTAKLPDGTAVFRAADGTLKTADGRNLSAAETAALLNPERLLSYERYEDAQDALQGARGRQDALADKQTTIDDARRKMNDPENPPSSDDLDDIEDDIQQTMDEMDRMLALKPNFDLAAIPESNDLVSDLKLDALAP